MRNIHLMEFNPERVDITLPQMELMFFIMRAGSDGYRIQDIAEGMRVSSPTVSVAVKKLEDQGWLDRHPDPEDKRASIITLSEKSIETLKIVKEHQRHAMEAFLEGITLEEQQQLIELLDRAVTFAEKKK
jgi:DNA-binding MarR family transcriptional regulator